MYDEIKNISKENDFILNFEKWKADEQKLSLSIRFILYFDIDPLYDQRILLEE